MRSPLNYFTHKFLRDHVEVLGGDENIRGAKKKAEQRFQDRYPEKKETNREFTNTLLCLSSHDLTRLIAEIQNRQREYAEAFDRQRRGEQTEQILFTSQAAYSYYERQGKRAKLYSPRQFRYNVRLIEGSYKMHHLHEMV